MKHILYFTADWCGPCKKIRPLVNGFISDGLNIKIIDVDFEKELVKEFEILSIPTFILFEDEKEIKRMTGSKTKEQLEEFFNG